MQAEIATNNDIVQGSMARSVYMTESVKATGYYVAENFGPVEEHRARYIKLRDKIAAGEATENEQFEFADIPLEMKWSDRIENTVTQEGKVVQLNAFLKSSAFTQTSYMGLIQSTGYTAIANTNTAADISITVATNGWREAPTATVANRGTPSWGTSTGSGGNASLATSSAVAFSIVGSDTIKGAFLVTKDLGGSGPSSTSGDTTGALFSAGLFTGGDKAVANGDTLNVTYTSTLT